MNPADFLQTAENHAGFARLSAGLTVRNMRAYAVWADLQRKASEIGTRTKPRSLQERRGDFRRGRQRRDLLFGLQYGLRFLPEYGHQPICKGRCEGCGGACGHNAAPAGARFEQYQFGYSRTACAHDCKSRSACTDAGIAHSDSLQHECLRKG